MPRPKLACNQIAIRQGRGHGCSKAVQMVNHTDLKEVMMTMMVTMMMMVMVMMM